MGDRRVGDRRSPDKGVIKIPFKDAIIYLVFAALIITSVSANIVLAKYYSRYKSKYEGLYKEYQELVNLQDIEEDTENTEDVEEETNEAGDEAEDEAEADDELIVEEDEE